MPRLDYDKKDDVVIDALGRGAMPFGFVYHQDSIRGFSEIEEKLKSAGVLFTSDFNNEWFRNYNLFASKDEAKIKKIQEKTVESYCAKRDDQKKLMVETWREIGLSGCCVERMEKDYKSDIDPRERYAMQVIDYSMSFNNINELLKRPKSYKNDLPESSGSQILVERYDSTKEKVDRHDKGNKVVRAKLNLKIDKDAKISSYDLSEANKAVISMVVLNTRLSRDIPMCSPTCKESMKNFTIPLLTSIVELGYDINSVSESAHDITKRRIFDVYWPDVGRNPGTDSIKKIIDSDLLININNIAEFEKQQIGYDLFKLMESEKWLINGKLDQLIPNQEPTEEELEGKI